MTGRISVRDSPTGQVTRGPLAAFSLEIGGIITVQEMVTSERNLLIEVIAANSHDLTEITRELGNLDLTIHSSQIVTNTYRQPFNYLEDSQSQSEADEGDSPDYVREPDT
ncbi:hypothetical protein [Halegenticoccus tardaugens]|uniref:hypothetical protein n=1 Tax=Halegenticoccus tardaugens TaxID=2071624 RepID=UPI001E524DE5|nr:hypothetical protein [Halegenticoccus tardaugens]